MEDQFLKANIKGEFVKVRAGYFFYEVPIEFSGELAAGKLSSVHELMTKLSEGYNKNVIEPFLKKEKERKAAEEKARIESAKLAREQAAQTSPEKPEDEEIDEDIPTDGEIPDDPEPQEGEAE